MADARDSKSRILHWVCGFDSHLRYSFQARSPTYKRAQNPGLSGVFAFLAEDVRKHFSHPKNSQPLSGLLSDSQFFGQVWAREIIRAGCLHRLTLLMRRSRHGKVSREDAKEN